YPTQISSHDDSLMDDTPCPKRLALASIMATKPLYSSLIWYTIQYFALLYDYTSSMVN
ncbi:6620_t:CDS:1, partial [Acaulospora colombiana]